MSSLHFTGTVSQDFRPFAKATYTEEAINVKCEDIREKCASKLLLHNNQWLRGNSNDNADGKSWRCLNEFKGTFRRSKVFGCTTFVSTSNTFNTGKFREVVDPIKGFENLVTCCPCKFIFSNIYPRLYSGHWQFTLPLRSIKQDDPMGL